MVIRQIYCKSILNKSGIPGIDYALNPYVGCAHKCAYCYAVFMKRFTNHPEPWGEFVDVKINCPQILSRQLKGIKQKSKISFGTVCDTYQPVEAKYELTRKCLEILIYYKHPISILTKSPLVLRDLDLILKFNEVEIGFTITLLEEKIRKIFEPNSAQVGERFNALKILSQNKILTWVFVAPLLPCFSDDEETLRQLFDLSEKSGAYSITFDSLNPYPKVWNNVIRLVKENFPERLTHYQHYYLNKARYEKQIKERISDIGKRFKIKFDFAF
ncbi:MAG: radical SAM protein [candidate division WOR-3 bacterium]